ncbi:MAG: peptide chain release factor-like protein [Pseudomonadota bacterium]
MRIPNTDVAIEFLRRSGPGGQHRNKRSTGVRIVHLPTGIIVMATERRSQAQNLEVAVERLAAILEKRARKPKPRVKTKATRGSKEERLRSKKARARTKQARRKAVEFE